MEDGSASYMVVMHFDGAEAVGCGNGADQVGALGTICVHLWHAHGCRTKRHAPVVDGGHDHGRVGALGYKDTHICDMGMEGNVIVDGATLTSSAECAMVPPTRTSTWQNIYLVAYLVDEDWNLFL